MSYAKLLMCAVMACAAMIFNPAHAGVAEVAAAEQAVEVAKAKVKALKAGLTKIEKAELAVALAAAKLAKAKGE